MRFLHNIIFILSKSLRRVKFFLPLLSFLLSFIFLFLSLPSFSQQIQIRFLESKLLLQTFIPLFRIESNFLQISGLFVLFWLEVCVRVYRVYCRFDVNLTIFEWRFLSLFWMVGLWTLSSFWFFGLRFVVCLAIIENGHHDLLLDVRLLFFLLLLLPFVGGDDVTHFVLEILALLPLQRGLHLNWITIIRQDYALKESWIDMELIRLWFMVRRMKRVFVTFLIDLTEKCVF